ncbi:MAG: hypothetical protein LBF17_04695, partial [Mediterranea sp.]|nr:hypothetical protein [Mediterranea sp.]
MTGRVHLFNALTAALIASVFLMYLSCKDEMEKFTKEHNFSMAFATRAGNTSADGLVPRMRLFTFGQNTKTFHSEALNITRTANKLSTQLETGTWNLAMVSSSSDYVLVAPKANVAMDDLPMYVYQPIVDKGRSASAAELFFQNKLTPAITAGTNSSMEAQLNRVVAKVELIIQNATPNFNLSGNHKIFLHDVPSTVSYTGRLLPDAANPTLLSNPLEAPVTLVQGTNGFLKASETIEFIIPAHQGSDFLSDAPSDVIGKKMSVAVDFERAGGGSRFTKSVEIDKVALCNRILRVNISINDGIALDTSVLPWERVDISGNVGRGFQNWLYVKEGGQGSGLSWNDALPDITSAIKNANALTGIGKTVHGILVAGGNTVAYPGGFTLPANLKLYGGWKGTSGTELASDDTTGPYTSVNRDLKTAKARIDAGSQSIVLSEAGTVLDGFIVEGSGDTQAKGLISLAHASAWINAVEIDDQATIGSDHALSISEGVGTNVLVARNNKGVSVTGRSRLVNATIANNAQASVFTGTLLNSVYWGNAGAAVTTGAINYCVFQGTPPAGTNYPVSDTNDRWFTANNVIPGPHFDLGATSGLARYEVGTAKPTRSPMLRRGSKSSFDNNLPITLDDAYKKDINGDTRFHTSIDGTTQVVDIGCYENATHKGFQLRWATENVYVSAKKGYSSQMPLLLPANEDPDINVGITWTVTVEGGSLTDCVFDGSVVNQVATGSNTGSGTGVMVGIIQFTPSVDYTKNKERKLGTINITTNLGIYLPDTKLEVWQTAGAQSKW